MLPVIAPLEVWAVRLAVAIPANRISNNQQKGLPAFLIILVSKVMQMNSLWSPVSFKKTLAHKLWGNLSSCLYLAKIE